MKVDVLSAKIVVIQNAVKNKDSQKISRFWEIFLLHLKKRHIMNDRYDIISFVYKILLIINEGFFQFMSNNTLIKSRGVKNVKKKGSNI